MYFLRVFLAAGILFFGFTSFANTSFAKKYPQLAQYLDAEPQFTQYYEDIKDDHICNEILEFANEHEIHEDLAKEGSKTSIATLWAVSVFDPGSVLVTEAMVFYGKCLFLNGPTTVEKNLGRAILHEMIELTENIPSQFFLTRMDEESRSRENGVEKNYSEFISAYMNIANQIKNNPSFSNRSLDNRLKDQFSFLINTPKSMDRNRLLIKAKPGQHVSFFLRPLYDKKPSLFHHTAWLELFISFYKVPQLHLFRFINHLKYNTFDLSSLNDSIEHAEVCMSYFGNKLRFFDSKPRKWDWIEEEEWTDFNTSIYEACEGLKEIALDFIDRGESLNFNEISHILELQKGKEISLNLVAGVSPVSPVYEGSSKVEFPPLPKWFEFNSVEESFRKFEKTSDYDYPYVIKAD